MATDVDIKVTGPFIGVNQTRESSEIDLREARNALNVNLDPGVLDARLGYDVGAVAPNGEPIEGTHDYRQNDGTRIFLVKAGNQLYRLDGAVFTTIGSPGDLTAGNLAQFLDLNNRVYITHGGVPKVTDGTSLFNWLIDKPGFAPDLAASGAVGAGKLNGTYDYKYVFFSSAFGQESPSSPSTNEADTLAGLEVTTTVTVENQNVVLSNFDTTNDARVDKFRIFRRKTSAFESDWFFVTEVIETTVTFTDRFPDNNIDNTDIAPLTFDQNFPEGRFLAFNAGTIFLSGIDTEPNNVYFTPVNGKALGQFFTVDDRVTGLLSFQGELVVFTQSSIWLVSGNSVGTLFPRRTIVDRGCLAPFSIVPVDNLIYFLSENGMYSYDLSRVNEVSRPVKPIWLNRNFSRDFNMIGVHDWQNSAIWWLYSDGTSIENDAMLVYFYRNTAIFQQPSWVPWDVPDAQYCGLITDSVTNLREIKLGFDDGRVSTYGDGGDDNGVPIDWNWETGKQDLEAPTVQKRWTQLEAQTVSQVANDDFMNVEISLNDTDVFEFVGKTQPIVDSIWRSRLARRSAQMRIRWSAKLNGTFRMVSWRLLADASARASR